MKKVIVEVEYEKTIKGNYTQTFDSTSMEKAEKLVKKKLESESGVKVLSMKSKEVQYQTQDWQDIEDVIFDLKNDLQEAKNNKGKDDYIHEDYIKMLEDDLYDFKKILQFLIAKDFQSAAEKYTLLDTAVRERLPERVYNLFESLNLI